MHGITGSPSEILPTANLLHAITGCAVSAPLLPGHGTKPSLLNRTLWTDWYRTATQALQELRAQNQMVFAAGLSMGGLLALHALAREEGLTGAVSINAPILDRSRLLAVVGPVLRRVRPYYPKWDLSGQKELAAQGRFAYEVMPLKAYQSMLYLRRQVLGELNLLQSPVLLIQSREDRTINPNSGRYLAARISGARLLELASSGHIATMGPEVPVIVETIRNFIEDLSRR